MVGDVDDAVPVELVLGLRTEIWAGEAFCAPFFLGHTSVKVPKSVNFYINTPELCVVFNTKIPEHCFCWGNWDSYG